MSNILPEPIGMRIARFREAQGWSLGDLATRMQLRGHRTLYPQRIFDIENGSRVVKPEELVSLARVLGVAITELLGVPDYAPLE